MLSRAITPKRKGRRVVTSLAALALISGTLLVTSTVLAVHNNSLFELGPGPGEPEAGVTNIVGNATDAGPDWDDLFDGTPTPAEIATAVAANGGIAGAFLADDLAQQNLSDKTTFSGAGGSNKNNDFISDADAGVVSGGDTWHWDSGAGLPPKDDLSNVYAYADIDASNHLIIYSGLERLDPSGDAYVDFEFFQDNVGLDEAIPCNDPGRDETPCHFTGVRTVNDLIVSMNFKNGGAIGSIEVRRWSGTEYVLVVSLAGEGCNTADSLCGFNNASPIDGGEWPNYDLHNNVITTLPANAFTEFGVDVTALIGGDPCITTMMAKTRSSASFTSELKDFAGPVPFAICGANISIGDDKTNPVGTPHTFTVTVNQTFGSTETPAPDGTDVDITLTNAGGANYTITSNTCDTDAIDPGTGVLGVGTVGGTCTITINSLTAGTVTAHASATFNVGGVDITVETDGIGENSGDAVKTYVTGAIRILKNSTKGGAVNNAGAVFAVDGPDAGTTADFSVTDDLTAAAPDEDADVGEVCVDGLIPGATYTVTETSPPLGYGAASQPVPNTAVAVAGDCPAGGTFNAVTFVNPPLSDIQVRFRDGGSGETTIVSMTCNNDSGTSSTADTTGWDDSLTVTGVAVNPGPTETVVCTIVIDP